MNIIKRYVRQKSTWLGLAKIGVSIGLYSSGVGGLLQDAILALFGLIDVFRNERTE
jgi:hypothetical protein